MMSELTAQNCHAERQGELFSAGAKFRGLEAHNVSSHKQSCPKTAIISAAPHYLHGKQLSLFCHLATSEDSLGFR